MHNQRLLQIIIVTILIMLALLFTLWFFNNFERAEREVSTGYSEKARRNPLLAAERFLNSLQQDAEGLSNTDLWRNLPDTNDVLIVYHMPPIGETRRKLLYDWVAAGGSLILGSNTVLDMDDEESTHAPDLLAELGVRAVQIPYDPSIDSGTTIEIKFTDIEETVSVMMNSFRHLVDTDDLASSGTLLGGGYGLLQYEIGEGIVTVFADNRFMTNWSIGNHDHALALALLAGVPGEHKVWLVFDPSVPSLLELAWNHAAHAVVTLLCVIALWLWRLGARLGPLLPPEQQPRRNIAEHLSASGNYMWKLDRAQALFHTNRRQIEHIWLAKHYLLRNMTPAERCEWIAARAGMSPKAVEQALYAEYKNENGFIELSGYLQQLREAL